MHITEGLVTGFSALATTAVSLAFCGIGMIRLKAFCREKPAQRPVLAMAGAFIFFMSIIPIPAFTGTCSHPCGTPLAAILLGPWVSVVLSGITLALQAALFAHGGFSTWGVNVLALGVGGSFAGWFAFLWCRRLGASVGVSGAVGGLFGNIMTYLVSGSALTFILSHAPNPRFSAGQYFFVIMSSYLPIQLPIALGEMMLTGWMLRQISVQRPELLDRLRSSSRGILLSLLFMSMASFALFGGNARAQQEPFSGMDESVNEQLAKKAGLKVGAPFVNIQQYGDLWNTLLLSAGGVCGFVVGRWSHLLLPSKKQACRGENSKRESS